MMLKTAFLIDVMVFVDSNVESNFALKFGDMTSTCKKHSTHIFTAEILRPDCVLNLLSNRRAKFKSHLFDMTVGKNQPRFECRKLRKL